HAALLPAAMHITGPAKHYSSRSSGDAPGDTVTRAIHPAIRRLAAQLRITGGRVRRDDRASQIVEFAISLPLLVLFVVGIFDFSGAISLKQKLTNAAREAARVAAADPANDLGNASGVPVSVLDAFFVVDNYLISEKLNDCR